ncbi:hypothetical protein [Streptomyces sp. NPDC056144]|uniref:hypothetical protein n=1 Tax=unclassified Streptomyces TaxID=2593676 RepID=UPI0035D6EF1F
MSWDVYVFRFVDGELAALDAGRFRQVIEPDAVGYEPGLGCVGVRAADGSTADVYADTEGPEGLMSVCFTHLQVGGATDVLVRVAETLDAVIVPAGCPVFLFREEQRRHLPPEFREEAVVLPATGAAFTEAVVRG